MKMAAYGSLVMLMISTSVCATPDVPIEKSQERSELASAALAKRVDADSLAAAGLLSMGNQAQALLTRAVDAAPDRPDLIWLQAQRCAQLPPCDPLPIERRLREVDPPNGAGWWGAIARAGAAHDNTDIDAALLAISRAERFDIYWTTLIAHLSRAVANTKEMSVQESEVVVIGYLAGEAIPAYQYISSSCKGERLQLPGATEVCRGVARALQNSDNYLTEMIGVAIAKRVWPEDSPEWKAAAERRRVYEYRSKLYPKLEQRVLAHPDEYLNLCARTRREQDVFAAQLSAAGYDPNPP
jgi:hypothetical protein